MSFEKGGTNEESLIRKVSRIRFFDSLTGELDYENLGVVPNVWLGIESHIGQE
jgi:hypothetical protein